MSQYVKQEVNWEFLLGSSKTTLQAYEQSRLNFAANVRKEISQLLDVWVNENTNALLARWLIERNLAADAAAVCADAPSGSAELTEPRVQLPCTLHGVPKAPARKAAQSGASTHTASDKIFGEKPFTPPRIHAAS